MSIEARSRDSGQKRERVSNGEFPIRSHHWNVHYTNLVARLANSDSATLDEACQDQTQFFIDKAKRLAWRDFEWDINYREMYGYNRNDNSIPVDHEEDVIGDDEPLLRRKMDQHSMDFLTLPDATPVVIGPLLDHICRSCAFGNGNGGLHCQTLAEPKTQEFEKNKLHEFLQEVDLFFGDPLRTELLIRYPDGIKVTLENATNGKNAYKPGGRDTDPIVEVHTSLGLFRDVITHKATRGKDITFDSYQTMLQAKGTSKGRSLSQ